MGRKVLIDEERENSGEVAFLQVLGQKLKFRYVDLFFESHFAQLIIFILHLDIWNLRQIAIES